MEWMMDRARETSQALKKNKRQDRVVEFISVVGQKAADDAKLDINVERCIARTIHMVEAAQAALEKQADAPEKGTDKWVLAKDFLALWEAKKSELPQSSSVAKTHRSVSAVDVYGRR